MLIKFLNEETSWVYNNEAVVAIVGKSATNQFQNILLSVNEIKSTYPFVCFDTPSKEDFNWLICEQKIENKLKFCMEERLSLCRTDMLFVLSELETTKDIDACLQYVEQVKDNGLSFFITHEKNKQREELVRISTKFKHIIYVEDEAVNLFYPVKQLICDYYRTGFIGIDIADVLSVFQKQHKMTSWFFRRSFSDVSSMKEYIPKLLQLIEERKEVEEPCPDFLVFIEASQNFGLDDMENILLSLSENYTDLQIIWSCNFNFEEKDNTCTLVLQTVYH